MGKLKVLIQISRPRFWLYLAGPYLLGFIISADSKFDLPKIEFLLPFLFFLIPANIILYGINDLFDKETDIRNPKKRGKENLLENRQRKLLKSAILISFLFVLPLFLISSTPTHLLILVSFLGLSVFYSAPPIRLKSKPLLDSISNVLYGLPAIWGFMQNSNNLPSIHIWIILFSWNSAMHLFSAIPDISADKKVGINTTAVFLGKNISLLICTILWIIFFITTVRKDYLIPFSYISVIYPIIPLLLFINRSIKIEKVYWYFPYINGFLGFLFFWIITFQKPL